MPLEQLNINFANPEGIDPIQKEILRQFLDDYFKLNPQATEISKGVHVFSKDGQNISITLSNSLLVIARNKTYHEDFFSVGSDVVLQVVGDHELSRGSSGVVTESNLVIKSKKCPYTVEIKQTNRVIKTVIMNFQGQNPDFSTAIAARNAETHAYFQFYHQGCKKHPTFTITSNGSGYQMKAHMVITKIPGQSLYNYLQTTQKISFDLAQNIISQCFSQLKEYWSKMHNGHGDVNLANFMYDEKTQKIRIIDFDRANQYIPEYNDIISMRYLIQEIARYIDSPTDEGKLEEPFIAEFTQLLGNESSSSKRMLI
jgi:hypothetical protein